MYRLPFSDDGKWVSAGNADDPSGAGHAPGGQYYAFDFKHNPEGAEVRAIRGGIVVFTENNQDCNTWNKPVEDPCYGKPGYGNAVLIRHRDNTVAAYNHMQKGSIPVVNGNWVAQGQKIGLSGNTGNSSEPHLHLDVRTYWNNGNDFGPTFPIIFQDKNHLFWRPKVGDELQSDNDYKRQEDWRWCNRCQGLFYAGNSGSVCPAGGAHLGFGNYILVRNTANAPGQPDWRWCSKCQGLFFSKHSPSNCPAGPGGHTGGGNYSLEHDIGPDYNRQDDWYRCTKCQGLFFGGNPVSECPAGPGGHSKGGGNYVLYKANFNTFQGNWRKCNKCLSLFYGGSGGVCPKDKAVHNKTGSKNYYIPYGFIQYPGSHHYRRCKKCSVLFFELWTPSKCAAVGDHDKTGSLMYSVAQDSDSTPTILAPDERGWIICNGCQTLAASSGQWLAGKCPNPLEPGHDDHKFDLLHRRHHGVLS